MRNFCKVTLFQILLGRPFFFWPTCRSVILLRSIVGDLGFYSTSCYLDIRCTLTCTVHVGRLIREGVQIN